MKLAKNQFRAACRGCHGGCVHILTVENGKLVKVEPDSDAPLNKGRACAKGISIIEQMYHPDRITYPMRRIGPKGSGQWERINWEEALSTIAARLTDIRETYGPESISMFTGTGRHHMAHFWRFSHVLGTPNGVSSGPLICLDPRVHAGRWTSGTYSSVDYYGKVKPGGILIWGSNPAVSGADGELQWFIKDAVKDGTPIIIVDPKPTELTPHADMWVRLRPGTDGALALGVLNVIISEKLYDREFVENWCYGFEELKARVAQYDTKRVSKITWVSENDIVELARRIATVKPLGLEWGCAIEQTRNSLQTCRALYILMGITGNYDVPGGFVPSLEIAPTADTLLDRLSDEMKAKCLSAGLPHTTRATMAHPRAVLQAMRDGQPYRIRAALFHANNALLSMPQSKYVRECLEKLDFMVCMDFFMTPTAELADIFLPAAFWPEIDEVFCMPEFSEQSILCMQKVVQVGECRSDEEVFLDLSRRMGLDYGADSLEDIYNGQLAEMGRRRPELAGITFEQFKKIGYLTPERTYYNYKKNGFATPSGKFELYSQLTEEEGGDPLPFWEDVVESYRLRPDIAQVYPLGLTTGSRRQQFFISNNRQITSLRSKAPFPRVSMNPETGAKYGIKDGEWVWIETPRGKITQKAKFVPEMDQRIVNCEMGWWYPEAGAPGYGWDESNVNVLTSGEGPYNLCFGSYQLRALLCRISPNPDCKIEERYYASKYYRRLPTDETSNSIVLDPNKCIQCGSCIEVCRDIQGVHAIDMATRGGMTFVAPFGGATMAETACVGCGQCTSVCPTGGIRLKKNLDVVGAALDDPNTMVVAQVAPSVRVGISDAFGLTRGENVMGRLTAALRKAGFDAVYDTTFSADLTIVEEANEFLERLEAGDDLPLFTSCCPAWVRFCEGRYPDLARHISTCRSPQQMLGAVLQKHYQDPETLRDKLRVVFVSIMPCTAKKDEIRRRESATDGRQDVDHSLTTVEVIDMLRDKKIDLKELAPEKPDVPYGTGSGGGEIFGVTGGVTEAALRYLMPDWGTDELDAIATSGVRGQEGIKEFSLNYKNRDLRIAVASGLANADALMQRVRAGEHFDLIEVMACPGGCIMGGGQPADIYGRKALHKAREAGLYCSDERNDLRRANENPEVLDTLRSMTAQQEHRLLHRNLGQNGAE